MTTTAYRCPLCHKKLERDLAVYLGHTQEHVIDQIKLEHPEWVEADGLCKPCAEYYERQMKGGIGTGNIGPRERGKRITLGIVMLAVSGALFLGLGRSGAGKTWRLLLFFPLFGSILGFFQAREKTCALLSELGLRNMDSGQIRIEDRELACRLKRRGRLVLLKSVLAAALVAFVLTLF